MKLDDNDKTDDITQLQLILVLLPQILLRLLPLLIMMIITIAKILSWIFLKYIRK